jgi:hypothetical protein
MNTLPPARAWYVLSDHERDRIVAAQALAVDVWPQIVEAIALDNAGEPTPIELLEQLMPVAAAAIDVLPFIWPDIDLFPLGPGELIGLLVGYLQAETKRQAQRATFTPPASPLVA